MKRIEYSAFEDCKNMRHIVFPEGLVFIGKNCFRGSGLAKVITPASLRTISQGAFTDCKNLRRVVLNEGLEVLGTNEYKINKEMYDGVFC